MPTPKTPKETLATKLAVSMRDVATIREESFDHDKADSIGRERGYSDFSQYYGKSLRQAVIDSCEKHKQRAMEPMVSLLLFFSWNDAVEWADAMLKTEDDDEV